MDFFHYPGGDAVLCGLCLYNCAFVGLMKLGRRSSPSNSAISIEGLSDVLPSRNALTDFFLSFGLANEDTHLVHMQCW